MAATSKSVHQEEESSASDSRSVGDFIKDVFLSFSIVIPWLPYKVPDLENWTRKLAACSTYDEHKWRDLSKGIGEFSEMRPCPLGEEEGLSASGPRNDNKWKESSNDEDAHSKASPARRLKGDVSVELATLEASSLGIMAPPLLLSSFPVEGASRDTCVLSSSSSPVEGTSRDTGFLLPFSYPIEGTLRDVRDHGSPKSSKVSSDHVPIEIGSTRAGETKLVDAGSTFEEAQRLCSTAFDKLKSELLCYEARLRKDLDGEKSLRLLCDKRGKELSHLRYELQSKTEDLERLWGEVGQAKYECNKLKAQIDAHIAAKKNALAKASALKVVDAQAEAEEIRDKTDRKMAIYLKHAVDARAKLRGASDREGRSNEYDRCKSRRETLEEIHARGFDLSEEIEQAKADEYDAKFLVSDAEDNEGEANEAAIPKEKVE
ncbi:uncharacterized protein [Nicotiana sylvestris]|uniref:uncharacterized protein n=1 Tax=Nicotiana sylvestris TaxID=4096 RepID=UPI00388C7A3F